MGGQILLFVLCMFSNIKTKSPESWILLSGAYISPFAKAELTENFSFLSIFTEYSEKKTPKQKRTKQTITKNQQNKQTKTQKQQ